MPLHPEDPDNDRHRMAYLDAIRRRRASLVPTSLKFGDPGGMGRRITPAAGNGD